MDHLQEEILEARGHLSKKEYALLVRLQQEMGMIVEPLTSFAHSIAWLDVFTSHALFAKAQQYCKPHIIEDRGIEIHEGRHPVIERFLPQDQGFIPNNLILGSLASTGSAS